MNNFNNNFISWFLGFCDAECSFICNPVARVNKQGTITSYRVFYRIQIGLNIIDRPILEFIQKNLNNLGKIYDYPHKNESTLCFVALEDIKYLIVNVFSNYPLLTSYQQNRLAKLKKGILNNISGVKTIEDFNAIFDNLGIQKVNIESLSKSYLEHWLIGFLNGEVSFTTFKNRGIIKPKVSLEHTDKNALILFKNNLDLGPSVLELKKRENRKITYRIDLTSAKDLNKICIFINTADSLIGNKLNQYQNWKDNFNL
uniref:Homing endonuclease LAGLIDADG domain-containing protein n=1 Tax=Cyclocybe aegerita TaxID=1973307 RepID=A0A884P6J4_CYCAE|nr:hypothetical protein K4014_mgp18 [Cyclocybe aegerita]QQP21458.1 hypothetical protein [Cyclocybe aegerita]